MAVSCTRRGTYKINRTFGRYTLRCATIEKPLNRAMHYKYLYFGARGTLDVAPLDLCEDK